MANDLTQILAKVQDLVRKVNAILPTDWKGNDAPNPHHFDAGSIVPSASLDIPAQHAALTFAFKDGGVAHTIVAQLPFSAIASGADPTHATQIVLDGETEQAGRVVFGHREGLEFPNWYVRLVVEFRFTDASGTAHDYRFDGDLPVNL